MAEAELSYQRDMVRGDLSHEEWLDLPSPPEVAQDLVQSAQIDGVLGQAAAAVYAHGDSIRGPLGKPMGAVEQAEGVEEGGPADKLPHRHHPSSQQAQAGAGQTTGQILRQHGQPLLEPVVAGKPGSQLLERLSAPVVVGDQVRADLVL